MFRDKRDNWCRAGYHELAILTQFEWLQANVDDLILPNVNVFEDMGVGRGFRRGSNVQAVIQGVSQPSIDMNNRWSICERASERKENEFEHERALFGHSIDVGSATWIFDGVVGRDALEGAYSLSRTENAKPERLVFGYEGGGEEQSGCRIFARRKLNC